MVEFGLLVKIWSVPTLCIYKIRCVPKIEVRKKTYPWEGTHTEYLTFVSAGVDVAVWSAAADSVAGGVGEVDESSISSLVVVVEIIVAAETVVEVGGGVSVVIDSVNAVVVCIMVTLFCSLKKQNIKTGIRWEKTRGGLVEYLSGSGKPFSNNSCSVSIYTSSKKKKKQNKTKQNKTKQNKTKQNKTKQNKTKQNKTIMI